MRKLLVFQHSAREPLGLLDPMLRRAGWYQAFRYGDRAYGLQFHLEADQPLIQRWLHVPEYRAEAEAAGPGQHLERILRDTHELAPHAQRLSERVFAEFIELFGWRRKVRLGGIS